MSKLFNIAFKKIGSNKFSIAVIGLGYVGLPLALEFAKKKIRVLGIDIDKDRLAHIQNKKSYITDISSKELVSVLKFRVFFRNRGF